MNEITTSSVFDFNHLVRFAEFKGSIAKNFVCLIGMIKNQLKRNMPLNVVHTESSIM